MKKNLLVFSIATLLTFSTFTLVGCGNQNDSGSHDTISQTQSTVSLSKTSITMGVGDSEVLEVNVTPNQEDLIYTWKSSDKNVVTVSKGTIEAVGDGTATISVTVRTSSLKTIGTAECEVTVKPNALRLSTTELSLYLSGEKEATITILNAEGTATWTSSNTSVATVSNGVVKAVGKGEATITASLNGLKADCLVKVFGSQLALNPITYATIGTSCKIEPTGDLSTNATWESSDSKIATIDNLGNVTLIKKGMTTITLKSDGQTVSTSLIVTNSDETEPTELKTGKKADTVNDPGNWYYLLESENATVESIPTIQNSLININVTHVGKPDGDISGANMVYLRYQPDSVGNKVYEENLYFYCENEAYLQIDGQDYNLNKGINKVSKEFISKAPSAATPAQIKFRSMGQFYIIPEFNFVEDVKELKLSENSKVLYLEGGESSFTLTGTYGGSEVTPEWTSTDEAVVTVANGVVTAVGEGTATIAASYEGTSDTCTVTVMAKKEDGKDYLKGDGQKATVANDAGNWYYLNDGEGSFVDFPYLDENGTIIAEVNSVGTSKFPMLRYQPDSVGGKQYTVSFDIKSSADAIVDYGSVSKAAISAGDNHFEFDYTSNAPAAASPFQIKIRTVASYEIKVVFTEKEIDTTTPTLSLDKENASIDLRLSDTLVLTATKENTEEDITWESSDIETATVDNGVVKALKEGNVVITAKCGELSKSCNITITRSEEPASTAVELSKGNKSATVADPGNWYYLNDGKTTLVETPTIDEGVISMKISSVDSANKKYAYLRYQPKEVATYNVSITATVESVADNKIDISGGSASVELHIMASVSETYSFSFTSDSSNPLQLKLYNEGNYTFTVTMEKAA